MTALRQRMIDDLRIRNFSPRTIQTYVGRVAKFAEHFDLSPDKMGREEVLALLLEGIAFDAPTGEVRLKFRQLSFHGAPLRRTSGLNCNGSSP